jgi:hypothetical protein
VLLRSPEVWILKLARQAGRRGELMLTEVGFGPPGRGLRKSVLIEVGSPFRLVSKTVLPIKWRATGPSRLFPEMEADVGVLPLDADRSQLSFNGRYQPPPAPWGAASIARSCTAWPRRPPATSSIVWHGPWRTCSVAGLGAAAHRPILRSDRVSGPTAGSRGLLWRVFAIRPPPVEGYD